jgi:hypothetical protein
LAQYQLDKHEQTMVHRSQVQERYRLALLIFSHIIVCCVSFVVVSRYGYTFGFAPPAFHIFYDTAQLNKAVAVVAAFALIAPVFTLARFSFGYFVGFYFYTMILGYLWLNCFTDLNYDHRLAGFSAAVSACAFLWPALLVTSPFGQKYTLSARTFDQALRFILLFSVATVVVGAFYNFRMVAPDDIYYFRDQIKAPTIVNYLVTIVSSALLPFAFAGFVIRKAHWWAAAVVLLLLFFYPITLSKVALLTPAWLVVMLLLSRIFEARTAVILSIFAPMLAGLALLALFRTHASFIFYTINFRLIAIPSVAMDVYNDFFSRHDLTYFCQISVLKPIMACPYRDQLSLVMEREFNLGNFNASLFATEGIASVGSFFAPVAAFACGLAIAVANRLSAGLPPHFILMSGAILPQVMLNVSLTTVLVTHGGAILFLLWYLTPRTLFERNLTVQAA